MKAAKVRITYDYTDTLPALRKLCREAEAHDYGPAGPEVTDAQPGRYACKVCGVVKIVKEVLIR